MKKQYDTKRLTDELSRSVFFQEPKQPDTSTTKQNQMQEKSTQAALATHPQSRLSTMQQADTAGSQQNEKAAKQQSNKTAKQQAAFSASSQSSEAGRTQTDTTTKQQSNKALKRFTSYLPGSILRALRVLAAQQDKKDYEVLQEAVEQYLAREQANK